MVRSREKENSTKTVTRRATDKSTFDSYLEIRNINCNASNATVLEVADEWPPLYSSSGCIRWYRNRNSFPRIQWKNLGILETQRYFRKKTRSFIIATLTNRGKLKIAKEQYCNTKSKSNWKSRWKNVATLTLKPNYYQQ